MEVSKTELTGKGSEWLAQAETYIGDLYDLMGAVGTLAEVMEAHPEHRVDFCSAIRHLAERGRNIIAEANSAVTRAGAMLQ